MKNSELEFEWKFQANCNFQFQLSLDCEQIHPNTVNALQSKWGVISQKICKHAENIKKAVPVNISVNDAQQLVEKSEFVFEKNQSFHAKYMNGLKFFREIWCTRIFPPTKDFGTFES